MSERRRQPWWVGLAVILAGAVCLYASSSLDISAQYAAIGPGFFVTAVGVGLVVLGVLLLVQMARGTAFDPELERDPGMDKPAFFAVVVAALLPVLVIETVGLPITAALSFTLVSRAFGSLRIWTNLLIGFILGTAAWFLFSWLGLQLGTFLPLAGL